MTRSLALFRAGCLVGLALTLAFARGAVFAEVPGVGGEPRYWAFEPVERPGVPEVRQTELVRNPVDAFLLARRGEVGLAFSPPAGKRELQRRVTFDLLGLPPTPVEVDDFLADEAPDA